MPQLRRVFLGLAFALATVAAFPQSTGQAQPAFHFEYDAHHQRARTWLVDMDMDATVDAAGFTVSGPIQAPEWSTRFRILGASRGTCLVGWNAGQASAEAERLEWSSPGITAEYLIGAEGLRQNFILDRRPAGTGSLAINMAVSTSLCVEEENGVGCLFRSADGVARHAYRDLNVWDACGTILHAQMRWNATKETLSLVVDDERAIYPITIDPVSTTANRILTPPIAGNFGKSVANAGDLNGDGYSDVVVGAYTAASGEAGEGLAYVYYGSATGIPAAPSLTLQADQAGANFGYSVDGAGDVNGDGYSDLVVGANVWENSSAQDKEGAMFVYHGSAAGLVPAPAVILQGEAVNQYMGWSVAGLGDINGDGYGDVGAGGNLACVPASASSCNEGIVWVFLGSATGVVPTFRHRLDRNQAAAQFGNTIAPAGDLNGDGYNDVVIGAPRFDLSCPPGCDRGALFIYHGSANALGTGANPAPTTIFDAAAFSTRTGWAVSTAGDVNADGYSDLIVGDWADSVGTGWYEGTAFIFHGSATGINTVPATTLQLNTRLTYFGQSVSTAGDVNGDGYADVVVGCLWYANGQTHEGASFLYLGSASGINSSPFQRYESNAPNAGMGESVSTAGDVNGDGYSDLILGANNQNRAYIVHGGTYNVSTTPSSTHSSGMAGARLGAAVANAGDVNGDGYSDAIFGAPEASSGQANEGLAHVHYGSAPGLSVLPNRTLETNIAGATFGASVASAGDVNGDGYADVVVGAPLSDGHGRAYIYHGSSGGLNAAPATTLVGVPGSLFGTAVFTAGDHNADGYSDVLIGAPGESRVYVYPGSASGISTTPVVFNAPVAGSGYGKALCTAGDVNGDGCSDIIIGAPDLSNGHSMEGGFYVYLGHLEQLPTTPLFAVESNTAARRTGTSVAGIGDANGDGFSDVAVGSPNASAPEANEGHVTVYYGSPAGTVGAGATVLQSNVANALLGTSVAEAGDVNGDGYADLIAGAPELNGGQAFEGRAWVYLGSPTGIVVTNSAALEPNIANERSASAVAGGGDVDGDGYSDVLSGSPNASPTATNEGTVRLYRGNNAYSTNRLTRQYRADLTNPLSTNSTDIADRFFFGIGHRARSCIQRTTAKLRWEVVHEGQPFTGAPITNSVALDANSLAWTDLGLNGVQIRERIPKAPSFYRHKWRVRVEYPLHKMIDGQRFSRWFYGYASAVGDIGVLPIELLGLEGTPIAEGNQLNWNTGSESNSSFFLVERSLEGIDFTPIGAVDAAGESAHLQSYAYLDADAPVGLSYYRLRMVDRDGSEELSPIVTVVRAMLSVTVFPVPVNDAINWSTADIGATRAIVRDALGRVVVDASTTGSALQGRPVQQLATGTYTLQLFRADGSIAARSRFLKR